MRETLYKKVKSIIPILIPLFASSFKRADALAIAMEARGYQGGDQRSRYRQLKWQNKDSYAILVLLILGAILYLLKIDVKSGFYVNFTYYLKLICRNTMDKAMLVFK